MLNVVNEWQTVSPDQTAPEGVFLHTRGYLRFYNGIETPLTHVILPKLSRDECTLVVLELAIMVVK